MKPKTLIISVIILCAVAASFVLLRPKPSQGQIIVIKYATHPALNQLEESFTTNLEAFASKNSFTIEHWNAGGSRQKAKQLAESASGPKVKLLVALATPAAQAVNDTPSSIPLLYGAVADPQGGGLTNSSRAAGIQNAGSNIVFTALYFLKATFPAVTNVGTIYNPNEPNSLFVQKIITGQASLHSLKIIPRQVTSVSQLKAVTEDLCTQVDAIYCANDNLVNLGAAAVSAAAQQNKKPFFIGELNAMVYGPTAAIGVDYTEMGQDMAAMAEGIVTTGKSPTKPHLPPPVPHVWYDEPAIKALGGIIPTNLPPNSRKYP